MTQKSAAIVVSCNAKLHAFNLAEQLQQEGLLHSFYTMYAYQKNTLLRRLIKRVDKEAIDPRLIHTILPCAFYYAVKPGRAFERNDLYDRIVSRQLKNIHGYKIFIGWSGMSLRQIRKVKQ